MANEIRATKAAAYVETDPANSLLVTQAAVYVEQAADSDYLRITQAAVYVEQAADNSNGVRVTAMGLYVECLAVEQVATITVSLLKTWIGIGV